MSLPDDLDQLAHVHVIRNQELGLVQNRQLLLSLISLNDDLQTGSEAQQTGSEAQQRSRRFVRPVVDQIPIWTFANSSLELQCVSVVRSGAVGKNLRGSCWGAVLGSDGPLCSDQLWRTRRT